MAAAEQYPATIGRGLPPMVHQRQPPAAGRHTRTRRYAQTLFTRKAIERETAISQYQWWNDEEIYIRQKLFETFKRT